MVASNAHVSIAIKSLMAIVSKGETMKYTNETNLPDPVVRALTFFQKDEKVEGLRVTTLIDAPQISQIKKTKEWRKQATADVKDLGWLMQGSAMHLVLEQANVDSNSYESEERLSVKVNGTLISGAVDLQHLDDDAVDLFDYKQTGVFKIIYGDYREWTNQLNVYAYLVRKCKKRVVRSVSVVAMLRDWKATEADRKSDYPPASILTIPLTLWSDEEQDAYVRERVRLHKMAETTAKLGTLPECTDEERWAKPAQYAVMKGDNKRALRVFDTQQEADAYAKKDSTRHVEIRAATYIRCANNYCGVAEFCNQWKER